MEDSRILNWRRWSPIRKSQVVVTGLGSLLTAAFVLGDALQITLPRNWLCNQLWGIGMLLEVPSEAVASFLGIWKTFPPWGFRALALSVNGILAFAVGTIFGLLISYRSRGEPYNSRSIHSFPWPSKGVRKNPAT